MKIAYFDCFSGISGNMVLGALLDLGLSADTLRKELEALSLKGYQLRPTRVTRGGLSGTYVEVETEVPDVARTLGSLFSILDDSSLDEDVKESAKGIFRRMAEAEAKIHDMELETVHLHEVAAIDTIVDIVGSLVGLRLLGIEGIVSSELSLGSGRVECQHGQLPIPAPITAEMVKGIPVRSTDVEAELTTPTGAAIITSLATSFGKMPRMKIEAVGYGAGKRGLPIPNLLRIFVGTTEDCSDYSSDTVALLETNIDDMNPQFYEHIMDRLFEAGALDVLLIPVQMKKNRPGIMLSVLAPPGLVNTLVSIIIDESTTLGVRISERQRYCLPRAFRHIQTRFGEMRAKLAYHGDRIVKAIPEYEDCRRAAHDHSVPVSQVYAEVQTACRDIVMEEEN